MSLDDFIREDIDGEHSETSVFTCGFDEDGPLNNFNYSSNNLQNQRPNAFDQVHQNEDLGHINQTTNHLFETNDNIRHCLGTEQKVSLWDVGTLQSTRTTAQQTVTNNENHSQTNIRQFILSDDSSLVTFASTQSKSNDICLAENEPLIIQDYDRINIGFEELGIPLVSIKPPPAFFEGCRDIVEKSRRLASKFSKRPSTSILAETEAWLRHDPPTEQMLNFIRDNEGLLIQHYMYFKLRIQMDEIDPRPLSQSYFKRLMVDSRDRFLAGERKKAERERRRQDRAHVPTQTPHYLSPSSASHAVHFEKRLLLYNPDVDPSCLQELIQDVQLKKQLAMDLMFVAYQRDHDRLEQYYVMVNQLDAFKPVTYNLHFVGSKRFEDYLSAPHAHDEHLQGLSPTVFARVKQAKSRREETKSRQRHRKNSAQIHMTKPTKRSGSGFDDAENNDDLKSTTKKRKTENPF